ncbi:DNA polymerase III subunit gamma/tau [candidate division GN15 bacterium]|nr:DNA polymerase III subunit gamma/tau [candidate division GN15 bacterium]
MSYLVFARKYRPQSFDQVVAQEHVTRTLRNALKNDRIASGYVFTGPRGTGKTTVARILAKSLNCVNGPTESPCGECPACKEIAAGSSLDVLEIDAASNTGVDDIRTLRENVRYLPTSGKKRIYIIDEVHRLSASAFDALLKTLEEPPDHVIFVMATTEPLKVPETILSRSQRFDFRRVSTGELAGHLRFIADAEGLEIDDAALRLLARKADGSVRDSLSLMDQIAAFAGQKIGEPDVVSALGLVDRQFLFDFVEAIAARERRKALLMVKTLFDTGVEAGDFLLELLDHFRSLLLLRTETTAGELLDLNEEETAAYRKQVEYFPVGDLLRMMKISEDIYRDLKSGLDDRLLLETGAVKMAELESTIAFEEILSRLNDMSTGAPAEAGGQGRTSSPTDSGERDFFGGSSRSRPAGSPSGNSVEMKRPAESAEPSFGRAINMPQLLAGWNEFLSRLRSSSPMLSSQVRMAELRSVKDNQIQAFFAASGDTSLELVKKREHLDLISRTLREHYKTNLTIVFDIDHAKRDTDDDKKAAKPKVTPNELVERSPRLRRLLERIDGEIIGIRNVKE